MSIKRNIPTILTKVLFCVLFLTPSYTIKAQDSLNIKQKSEFWRKVQFGGGLGLGVGNNYTNITLAPSAVYRINDYVATGLGLQYSYVKLKREFQAHMYGASIIGLFDPIQNVQLSVELEQLRVNNTLTYLTPNVDDDFWNTALFLGGGYRTNNVTMGIRYNVLFKSDDRVYSQAWMPFVRVYF